MMPFFSTAEIAVNTVTEGRQGAPVVAALADGGFVAAWTGPEGIRARFFLADGSPAGAETGVAGGSLAAPSVAVMADGRVVIGWAGDGDVRAQVLSAAGVAEGEAFTLSQSTADLQGQIALTALAGGGFAAAWVSRAGGQDKVFTRQFPAGETPGDEVAAGAGASDGQAAPMLRALAGGGFALIWEDGMLNRDIRLRLFDSAGHTGTELMANSVTAATQAAPEIAVLADGSMIAVWHSAAAGQTALMARHFGADGVPSGAEFTVAASVNGQVRGTVTALADGGYAIAWEETINGDYGDARLRVFDAADAPAGDAITVHAPDAGQQGIPQIAGLADGRLVLVWGDGLAMADVRARILDPRVKAGGGTVGGEDGAPRLLGLEDDFTVAAAGHVSVMNQHGVQSEGGLGWAVGVTVAGVLEVDADHGSYDAIRLTGMSGEGIGGHDVSVAEGGVVRSLAGLAVRLAGGGNTITNFGRIEGEGVAILGGEGSDSVVNGGMISGAVLLGGGNDTLDGRGGQVTGGVAGGAGDDLYLVSSAGMVLTETAGEGIDRVQSTVSLVLGGNFERLDLLGAGNIAATGNSLANVLTGNGGANRLTGAGGRDTMAGGAGGDRLAGDAGDDRLAGGQGNDRLSGGAGRDQMAGGAGADVFVFAAKGDSRVGTPDLISDFRHGADRIDLSALTGPKLAYLGDAAFGAGVPAVRLAVAGSMTTVQVDIDGDARADLAVALTGIRGMTAADFLL